MKRNMDPSQPIDNVDTGAVNVEPDTEIVVNNGHFTLVSAIDDYANRGDTFDHYCLYNYIHWYVKTEDWAGSPSNHLILSMFIIVNSSARPILQYQYYWGDYYSEIRALLRF